MAEVVKMPKLSDTMTEGVVAQWLKKVGDPVKNGELIAEIETDKATMEFESFYDGVLLYIGVEKGQSAPVDAILAIIGKEGEDISSLVSGGSSETAAPKEEKKEEKEESSKEEKKTEEKTEDSAEKEESDSEDDKEESKEKTEDSGDKKEKASQPVQESKSNVVQPDSDGRLKASPLARKMAADKGIDIGAVSGSGDSGRIVKRDVENYTPAEPAKAAQGGQSAEAAYTDEPVSQMRKTIAK
ncbi:MAG: biotin/lipoyl-containing protein, partial [Bacteroidota bacterium]